MTDSSMPGNPCTYWLVFAPLHSGCSFSFPCNQEGVVGLDDLSESARRNYLQVQGRVGLDFQVPSIVRRER